MGNRIQLDAYEFKHLRTGEIEQGFIFRDDYTEVICNYLDKVPRGDLPLLRLACKTSEGGHNVYGEAAEELLNFIRLGHSSILINGKSYDYKAIEEIILAGEKKKEAFVKKMCAPKKRGKK